MTVDAVVVTAVIAAVATPFAGVLIWMQGRIDRLEKALAEVQERLLDCEKARSTFEARLSLAE